MRILLAPDRARPGWVMRAVDDGGRPIPPPAGLLSADPPSAGLLSADPPSADPPSADPLSADLPGADLPVPEGDLPGIVRRIEADADADAEHQTPRWVWPDAQACYPALVRAGVRVQRCHDLALTESVLLGHEGRWGEPRSLAAAYARLTGAPVPDDPVPGAGDGGATLFDQPGAGTGRLPPDVAPIDAVAAVHAAQLERVAAARAISPGFALLVAAESASGLAAVEMSVTGLPWRVDRHDGLLTGLLGPRPSLGGRPPRLVELAGQICAALDAPTLNPDSPAELLAALRRVGLPVQTTRRWELRDLDHPAIAPLLRYKELARLHVAHGWAWRDQWVRDGRFHPEYVPGGVVSGRWATRGGGALQIPKAVRGAVAADPGWALVVADAGQLEPRLLAAISGDPGMIAATREGDLYAAIAAQALGRPEARAEAKLGLLAAMYGGGAGSPALAALRRRFPKALDLLEQAADQGERGDLVRSVLGRTCPPPAAGWLSGPAEPAAARARARGRFTRNFVVQASAADWAGVLVAGLRRRLASIGSDRERPSSDPPGGERPSSERPGRDRPSGERPDSDRAGGRPELVFFQHDEVLVHTPRDLVDQVIAAVVEAGDEATRMVVGRVGVAIPLDAVLAASYAEKGGPAGPESGDRAGALPWVDGRSPEQDG